MSFVFVSQYNQDQYNLTKDCIDFIQIYEQQFHWRSKSILLNGKKSRKKLRWFLTELWSPLLKKLVLTCFKNFNQLALVE